MKSSHIDENPIILDSLSNSYNDTIVQSDIRQGKISYAFQYIAYAIKTNSHYLILGLILVIAAALRFNRINFGLPDLLHIDESFEINRALRLAAGSFDYSRAGKGGFYFIIFGLLGVSYITLRLTGVVYSPSDFALYFVSHEENFYLMSRVVSGVIGIVAIYFVYRIGKEFGGKIIGLTAAFLLTVSSLNIVNAHFATVDTTLTLFLILSFLFLFRTIHSCETRNIYLSGLFCGLSLITKMTAVVLIVPFIASYAICFKKRLWVTKNLHRHFAVAITIFVATTFIGEPGYLKKVYDSKQTASKLYAYSVSDPNDSDFIGLPRKPKNVNLFQWYFKVILQDIGLPLFIFFVISMTYFLATGSIIEILIISFLLPYYFSICTTSTLLYYSRYTLPIIFLVIITASRGIWTFVGMLKSNPKTLNKPLVYTFQSLLVLLICLPTALNGIRDHELFDNNHPRIVAKKWIMNNIAPNSKILMEGSPEHRSQLLVQVENNDENILRMIEKIEVRDSGKARYWNLRRKYLNSIRIPRYDLYMIPFDEKWLPYDQFKNTDIEYIVVDKKRIENVYRKRTDAFAKSRISFYDKMMNDTKIKSVKELSDKIAIFKLEK